MEREFKRIAGDRCRPRIVTMRARVDCAVFKDAAAVFNAVAELANEHLRAWRIVQSDGVVLERDPESNTVHVQLQGERK